MAESGDAVTHPRRRSLYVYGNSLGPALPQFLSRSLLIDGFLAFVSTYRSGAYA
jgi:hypothetical protein